MTLVHYTAEVKSGRLLELPAEAEALHLKPGDKVDLQFDAEPEPSAEPVPNRDVLAMLLEIATMKAEMKPTNGAETDRLLREARAGAMYGDNLNP